MKNKISSLAGHDVYFNWPFVCLDMIVGHFWLVGCYTTENCLENGQSAFYLEKTQKFIQGPLVLVVMSDWC